MGNAHYCLISAFIIDLQCPAFEINPRRYIMSYLLHQKVICRYGKSVKGSVKVTIG